MQTGLAFSPATGEIRISRPSTIERAYELAGLGSCRTVADIATALKREGHDAVEAHLAGSSIRKDLRRLCAAHAAGRQSAADPADA